MASSSSVIILDDSDTDDIQILADRAANAIFCQFCQTSLTKHSVEARQVHYEQHFGEEGSVLEDSSSKPHSERTAPTKRKESMNIIRRKIPLQEDKFWHIDSKDPVPKNYSPGLLPVIKQALIKSHSKGSTTRAALCADGVVHISTQGWDRMWGCGYRNFLMSCTALMSQDVRLSYIPQLIEQPKPGVRNLQRWIEAAWSAGFDREGQADLKPLVDSTKWIGTVEISVAFTYRGIPTKLVDFPEVDKSAEIVTKWIVDYFGPVDSSTSKPLVSVLESEKKTVGDVLRGASPIKVTDRMPLILQHQGHSRTIVGYEVTKNGSINLITFDPARMPPENARQAGLSQLSLQQNKATASSSTSKGRQFFDRVLHPRGHHRTDHNTSSKGKKRQASPSPCPTSRSDESRLVKRVRGGVQTGDSVAAVSKAVEVIDVDDDEIQIVGQTSPNDKYVKTNVKRLEEAVDHLEVMNHFRLRPANVGKKHKYQILYFTMEELLTEEQKEERKTVHSTPVKQNISKGKRAFFHI